MDPVIKRYLNSIRCPICRHQIDIMEKDKRGNNYGCVRIPTHYAFRYITTDGPYRVEREDVNVYSGKYLYEIRQYYWSGLTKKEETVIYIKEVDKEFRIIEKGKTDRFQYDKLLFNFQDRNTDESKIINRVRTILTFQ